jgi:hypothetical protein
MAKISDLRTVQIIKGILDAETAELSQYKLATDMIREAGPKQGLMKYSFN